MPSSLECCTNSLAWKGSNHFLDFSVNYWILLNSPWVAPRQTLRPFLSVSWHLSQYPRRAVAHFLFVWLVAFLLLLLFFFCLNSLGACDKSKVCHHSCDASCKHVFWVNMVIKCQCPLPLRLGETKANKLLHVRPHSTKQGIVRVLDCLKQRCAANL